MESGVGPSRLSDCFGRFTAWGFYAPYAGRNVLTEETTLGSSSSCAIPAISSSSLFGERRAVIRGDPHNGAEPYNCRQLLQKQCLTRLKLGQGRYSGRCDAEEMEKSVATTRVVSAAKAPVPKCQVESCNKTLVDAKDYHKRHKVCEMHSKAPCVVVFGVEQRFCQQCSRFHVVSEFDDAKRSCRRRLAGHNERRRKSSNVNASLGTRLSCTAVVEANEQ